jgi:preprotein translocase subunit SecE
MRNSSVKSKANLMVVNKAETQEESRLDWLKWSIAIILLLAGLIGNHYYSEVSLFVRTGIWLAVVAAAGFVASKTKTGQWVVDFVRESRTELRKVIWPTREETLQTTLVVAVMVVILALLLWGLDGILVWLIGWLTGQRG